MIYCIAILYRLNQELKFLYKKKHKPNERLHRANLESASQWQGMWLCVVISINMKFYNTNDNLYDKCNKKLGNLCNLKTKHKKNNKYTNK